MRRTFRLCIVGLGSMLIVQLAAAEVVVLRDGSRKEGTVVGRGPNGVALQMADGQLVTFSWQQVQTIEGLAPPSGATTAPGGVAAPPAGAAPAPAASPSPAASAGAPPAASPEARRGDAADIAAPAPVASGEREPARASRPPRQRAPAASGTSSGGLAPLLYLAGVVLMVAVCGAWFAQVRKQGDDERKVPAPVPLVAAVLVLAGGLAAGPFLFPPFFSPLLAKFGLGSDPALAGAQQLMQDMAGVQNLAELAELLTDESAAAMSLPMLFLGGMLALFGGQGAVQQEFEAAFAQFGVSANTKPEEAAEKLRGHGREILTRLSSAVEAMSAMGAQGGLDMSSGLTDQLTPEFLDKLVYTKISDTRVRIDHPEESSEVSIEARLEDGAWRLQIGNLDEIMGQIQESVGGMGALGMPRR